MPNAVCNSVQRIPLDAALYDRDRRPHLKVDRDFPGSAAIGFNCCQLEGLAVARPWGFESPFRTNILRGDFVPADPPYDVARGAPRSPLRSVGSLAPLVREAINIHRI